MKHLSFIGILLLIGNMASFGQKANPLSIGEILEFHSSVLQEDRVLNVYLPQGYRDSDKQYPVIYLLDGSIDEDFIHISGLVQFGSFSWIEMLPETIVVGIANVDRKRDFTYPSTDKAYVEKYPMTGHSKVFIQFLEEEVQPLIEKNFRSRGEKTLIGQSLGGLLATEILLKQPELFDNYIIVSPSLWYDYESLLKIEGAPMDSPKSVYIAVGEEGDVMKRVAEELHKKLLDRDDNQLKVYFKFLPDQDHGDALHLAVYDAFERIFSKKETNGND